MRGVAAGSVGALGSLHRSRRGRGKQAACRRQVPRQTGLRHGHSLVEAHGCIRESPRVAPRHGCCASLMPHAQAVDRSLELRHSPPRGSRPGTDGLAASAERLAVLREAVEGLDAHAAAFSSASVWARWAAGCVHVAEERVWWEEACGVADGGFRLLRLAPAFDVWRDGSVIASKGVARQVEAEMACARSRRRRGLLGMVMHARRSWEEHEEEEALRRRAAALLVRHALSARGRARRPLSRRARGEKGVRASAVRKPSSFCAASAGCRCDARRRPPPRRLLTSAAQPRWCVVLRALGVDWPSPAKCAAEAASAASSRRRRRSAPGGAGIALVAAMIWSKHGARSSGCAWRKPQAVAACGRAPCSGAGDSPLAADREPEGVALAAGTARLRA